MGDVTLQKPNFPNLRLDPRWRSRLRLALFDLVNGVRSQIPICCVLFFVHHILRGEMAVAKVVYDRRGLPLSHGPGYVQCQRCFGVQYSVEVRKGGPWCSWLLP